MNSYELRLSIQLGNVVKEGGGKGSRKVQAGSCFPQLQKQSETLTTLVTWVLIDVAQGTAEKSDTILAAFGLNSISSS